jgi:hypothetical protein
MRNKIGYKLCKKDNGGINAIKFNDFYNEFIKDKYKNNLLILDNANFHRSKIVKENIQNSNNKIIYSLPYNPACNPNFILILLNNESKHKVISRFNNKNITSKIHIFPGMDHFNYLNLMNISDIILDPFPFGGCNSSLEAFSLSKIVITHASDMINGRFTTGFYKKMVLVLTLFMFTRKNFTCGNPAYTEIGSSKMC